ncbi:Uncharacterized membrane protein [Pseudoxanthomonas wuyuanensis]|uniref:Uncharacterized membrane protein n=1 Tax=Pseudoxanthomonas wuyuanensis TaxID=1073196 RepID=A0A286D3N0_9GAMM|nr:Uncharacterized membrane protein [Pseudoxanthomonas wuyuanensis]
MDELTGILLLVGLAVLAVPVLMIAALVAISGLKRRVTALEAEVHRLRTSDRPAPARSAETARPQAAATPQIPPVPVPQEREPARPTSAAAPPPATVASPPPLPETAASAGPAGTSHSPLPLVPPRPSQPQQGPRQPVPPSRPDILTRAARAVKRWFTVGNVPVKIGVLVLFAGVAALLKYASDQGLLVVPIELRLAGIAAAALAALGFAWRKRDSNRIFALSLQGGAIGVLLLTVFAAFKMHGMMPVGAAFALSVVLIAGAGMLAVLQNAKALAVFAILAGFLAPIWLSTGSGNHVALFSYYAVLNAAILGIAWWRSWRVLNLLGFVFTFGIGTLWGVLDYQPRKFASTEPFLLLFFAFYLLIPMFFARRQPASRRDFIDGCLVFGTPLIAFSLQAGLLRGDRLPLAFCALGLGALYAGLAWAFLRRLNFAALGQSYALLAVGFATLSVPLALSAQATACVFALEGAALVWLGLRQQRWLPQLTGAGLQLAAALAFAIGAGYAATAIANPVFMGALLIALAAFASAWACRDHGNNMLALPYYLWGLLWWLGNGINEIERFIARDQQADALLAFAAVTGWLAAEVHRRRPDAVLAMTTLGALAVAVPLALTQSWLHGQPFAGAGILAWAAFAVLGLRSLVSLRAHPDGYAVAAQFVWWLVWPFVLSLLFAYLADRFELAEGWRVLGIGLPWLAVAALSLFRWPWLAQPLGTRFDAARTALQSAYFLVLSLGWLFALTSSGGSAPLPWLPLLNPLELAQLSVLALAACWFWSESAPRMLRSIRWMKLAAVSFVFITSSVLHTVHHWGGVRWNESLLSTSLAQTSLTVVWSVLGVLGWVVGSRREHRGLWLAGAVLMGVVLIKLVLVDRGNLGNVLGIASFIAYGLLCTVVGYLAPAPPRAHTEETAA